MTNGKTHVFYIFNRRYIFIHRCFVQCHVSFWGCNSWLCFTGLPSFVTQDFVQHPSLLMNTAKFISTKNTNWDIRPSLDQWSFCWGYFSNKKHPTLRLPSTWGSIHQSPTTDWIRWRLIQLPVKLTVETVKRLHLNIGAKKKGTKQEKWW